MRKIVQTHNEIPFTLTRINLRLNNSDNSKC